MAPAKSSNTSRLALLLAAGAALVPSALAIPQSSASLEHAQQLARRGSPEAPDGYTPKHKACPSERPKIHDGAHLSAEERDWIPKRRNETVEPIRDLLRRIAIPDFDSDHYLRDAKDDPTALPNIGLAVSGGGYRAMLSGGGAIAAWDSRSSGSTDKGNLGGLLQSATYLSGLSGGSWLVGSIYMNNFTSVQDIIKYNGIWELQNSIFSGPQQYSILAYYDDIFGAVSSKKHAGFQRSLTDYWGRMLSYQLINATDGGPSFTWSSIADDPDFSSGKAPMPLVVAVGRNPNETVVALNSTVFEFNPWYLGSVDPTLRGFVPLKYAGSSFKNGSLAKGAQCVLGFDNAGFVMGTSSSLFNAIVLYINEPNSDYVPSDVPTFAVKALTSVLDAVGDDDNDIADWTPNPFYGWNVAKNPVADNERLTLVDGGEDLQNVPYHPLIVRERDVDVIFSFDSSADTESGWPDGASIIATYERSLESIAEGTSFPAVPGLNTFLNLGLNTRPTFFGCDASNTTVPAPLVVYIPSYPYVYAANISTFKMEIEPEELSAIVENGYNVATQLNATRDPDWPVCVACAMLSRSFDRTNATVPAKCKDCFQSYCWNGTLDESQPKPYWPDFVGDQIKIKSLGARLAGSGLGAVAMAAAAAFAVML